MRGYEKLATLLSSSHSLQLFRKFGALQMKNILYLQAELTILEAQLADIMQQDQEEATNGIQEKVNFLDSWLALKESDQNLDADNTQYRKVIEIRKCLKEYCDALLQQAEINRLSKASESDHKTLAEWLDHPKGGKMFLQSRETFPWRKEHFADLVCLSENGCETALFDRMWRDGILPLYHQCIGRHIKDTVDESDWSGIHMYSDTKIAIAPKLIGTVLAALLPTASIFALYFVKPDLIRLGMIMAFTTTFAVTLSVFTRGSMFEVFAASTAFAAVEVVFVGGFN